MADSIFTKIIKGEEPGEVLYEDVKRVVMLTRAPNTTGHCLVVPKKQDEFFYDMDPADYEALMDLSRRFSIVLKNVFRPKTVGLAFVGLGVPHVHVHLIPVQGEHDMDHDKGVFVDVGQLKPAADKIRSYLAENPLSDIQ